MLTKRERFKRHKERVLYVVGVMEVATVQGMTGYLELPTATIRRAADSLVRDGKLTRRKKRFWNGMHYTNRNYYELPKKVK